MGAFWDAGEGLRGTPALLAVTAGGDASAPLARRSERQRVDWVARRQPLVPASDVLEGRSVCVGTRTLRGRRATPPSTWVSRRRCAPRFAAPLSRLTFAGEHTSLHFQGYVNGAVETGRRAAEEVLALLARDRLEPVHQRADADLGRMIKYSSAPRNWRQHDDHTPRNELRGSCAFERRIADRIDQRPKPQTAKAGETKQEYRSPRGPIPTPLARSAT